MALQGDDFGDGSDAGSDGEVDGAAPDSDGADVDGSDSDDDSDSGEAVSARTSDTVQHSAMILVGRFTLLYCNSTP